MGFLGHSLDLPVLVVFSACTGVFLRVWNNKSGTYFLGPDNFEFSCWPTIDPLIEKKRIFFWLNCKIPIWRNNRKVNTKLYLGRLLESKIQQSKRLCPIDNERNFLYSIEKSWPSISTNQALGQKEFLLMNWAWFFIFCWARIVE